MSHRKSISLPRSLKKMKNDTQAFIANHLTPTKRKLTFEPLSPRFEKILGEATEKEMIPALVEDDDDKVKSDDDSVAPMAAPTFGLCDLHGQLVRQLRRQRPVFNLMVAGQSGLGKSSFVNSLFCTEVLKTGPLDRMPTTTKLEVKSIVLQENQIQLDLTVIDTPGFGGGINNNGCLDSIVDYIDAQYEYYRKNEFSLGLSNTPSPGTALDTRVHCCLYFIAPNGHALSQLDILALTQLSTVVNVVAVIARADTLNPDELAQFKRKINEELGENRIKVYDFCGDVEALKKSPFAVVSHNSVVEDENGELVRVRAFPWGCINVDMIEHFETKLIQNLLIREHFFDLVKDTHEFHYQNYRTLVAAFPKQTM